MHEAYTNDALTDEMVESIKDMPIWFAHTKNDPTVKSVPIDEDGNFVSNGNYSPEGLRETDRSRRKRYPLLTV